METVVSTIILLIVVCSHGMAQKKFNFNFHQNDYQVIIERVETTYYNKVYMKPSKIIGFKYNRTVMALNGTFQLKIDLHKMVDEISFVNQGYKFASNEYRLFPVRVGAKLREVFQADSVGVNRITKCGNFTLGPVAKNEIYHFCNFVPDCSKLPPFIPSGRFKSENIAYFRNELMFSFNAYITVTRPEVTRWES